MKDFYKISSRDNPAIKQIIMLNNSADKRKKEGAFVLEGFRLCRDAFDNNVAVKRLIVSETALEKHKTEIDLLASESAVCNVVPDHLMEKISDTKTPQGVIMLADIPAKNDKIVPGKRYIALENIQDPSNLGTITRTAEALGFGGIILTENGCDPFSPKALRASMGTLLRMPLYFTESITDACFNNGLEPVACVVDNTATDIKKYRFKENDVLLIGNEGNGLSDAAVQSCKVKVTIKMTGRIESLNAAAAAAIAMWELCR